MPPARKPDLYEQVVEMRDVRGMKFRDIGAALGVSTTRACMVYRVAIGARRYSRPKPRPAPRPKVVPPHGTHARYAKGGCRCDACREAHREYNVAWAAGQLDDYTEQRLQAFEASDLGAVTRICACPNGHSLHARDFVTNGLGATLAVCPRCDWHAPAASTRGAA